jgi:uncharacterized protein (DUF983 family)
MQVTLGQAILKCRCPKCRQGAMFVSAPLKKWYSRRMFDRCTVCGQVFEPEPGFYYGAMYVSYAFSVAILVAVAIALSVFVDDPPIWVYMVAVSTLVLILWPLMYRYSRSIFLHLFGGIRYNAKYQSSE